jgi:predicted transcriptional regulator
MFVRRKDAERNAARRLRAQGLALRTIAAELGVALSSVSVWVRDVPRGPALGLLPGSRDDTEHTTKEPTQPVEKAADKAAVRSCSRCGQLLPVTAFNRNGDGYQWWCRACFREYFRNRGELHRDQVRASKRKRRARAKAFVHQYLKTHACVDCSESDPEVLEFDHIGAKKDHISRLADSGYSKASLEAEISACEVVCVNCHRRRRHGGRGHAARRLTGETNCPRYSRTSRGT